MCAQSKERLYKVPNRYSLAERSFSSEIERMRTTKKAAGWLAGWFLEEWLNPLTHHGGSAMNRAAVTMPALLLNASTF